MLKSVLLNRTDKFLFLVAIVSMVVMAFVVAHYNSVIQEMQSDTERLENEKRQVTQEAVADIQSLQTELEEARESNKTLSAEREDLLARSQAMWNGYNLKDQGLTQCVSDLRFYGFPVSVKSKEANNFTLE